MKLVYIAGPFTAPTQWQVAQNIRAAESAGRSVALVGHFPVIPHVIGKHYGDEQTDAFWYDGTLELMRRCDAVFLMDTWQSSVGATREVSVAQQIGLPVFASIEDIAGWR